MKSSIDLLAPKTKQLLARLYETEYYPALVNLLVIERDQLAKDHVGVTDLLQICNLSGQTISLKKLVTTLKEINKTTQKKGWYLGTIPQVPKYQLCWPIEQI